MEGKEKSEDECDSLPALEEAGRANNRCALQQERAQGAPDPGVSNAWRWSSGRQGRLQGAGDFDLVWKVPGHGFQYESHSTT